jgi:hypothetical protein
MADYGYLHLGRVLSFNTTTKGYDLEGVGLARTSRWGPVPSCVPGLVKGDRVVLAATGTSRDNLTIIAKLDATFPAIADIAGLVDALAAKAAQVDLTALTTRTTNVEGRATTLENRATSIESVNTTQNTNISNNTTSINTNTTNISSNTSSINTINAWRPYNRADLDLYGDLISTVPRHSASSAFTLPAGTLCVYRAYADRVFNFTKLNVAVTTIGAGPGTANVAIYVATAAAPNAFTLYATAGLALTALGQATATFNAAAMIDGYPHVLLGVQASGFTTIPALASSPAVARAELLNPSLTKYSVATKAGTTWPSSLALGDGTWAAGASRVWMGLSA